HDQLDEGDDPSLRAGAGYVADPVREEHRGGNRREDPEGEAENPEALIAPHRNRGESEARDDGHAGRRHAADQDEKERRAGGQEGDPQKGPADSIRRHPALSRTIENRGPSEWSP